VLDGEPVAGGEDGVVGVVVGEADVVGRGDAVAPEPAVGRGAVVVGRVAVAVGRGALAVGVGLVPGDFVGVAVPVVDAGTGPDGANTTSARYWLECHWLVGNPPRLP
jgi:hypothetical protein